MKSEKKEKKKGGFDLSCLGTWRPPGVSTLIRLEKKQ